MTILFEHTSEGATDEQDVAAGATGYGTPWAVVSKTGTVAIKYDTTNAAQGLVGIRITRPATTDTGYCRANVTPSARIQVRFYYRHDAAASAQTNLVAFRNATNFMGYVGINSDGKLQIYNSSNTGVSGSAHATKTLASGVTYRIEAAIKPGATGTADGTLEFAYYIGDSTSAEHSFSSTTVTTGTANCEQIRFGIQSTGTGVPTNAWFDDLAVGDGAAGWLGPSSVTPPTAVVTGAVKHVIDATGSSAPSGTLSFAISQTSGTTTAPTLLATGIWSVTPHASETLVYLVTVTSSAGGSDSESYSVPPLTAGPSGPQVKRYRKNNVGSWV